MCGVIPNPDERFQPCKQSPGSFLSDEPPALNFRAALTEGGAYRVGLARA